MSKHSKDLAFHRRMHSKYADEVSALEIEVESLRRALGDSQEEVAADSKNNRELGVRTAQLEAREAEHLRDMLDCQERVVRLLVALRTVVGEVRKVSFGQPIGHIAEIAQAAIQKEEKEGETEQGEGCRCVVGMGKMRWVSVIDSQTCGACREMDGKLVTDQRPPLHDCEHEREGS